MSNWWIECGDSAGLLKLIPDNSVNLIATDPPYYRVKDCDWDKQWKTVNEFLGWLRSILAEFQRILKPNGSLYLFTSPQMSARVECLVGELFTVLNRITWRKPPFSTKAEMFTKEDMRKFFPASESIIFAEHFGADNTAKGEVGYTQKCDELRGFVFEPLRLYFDTARKESGLSSAQIQDRMKELTGCRYVFDKHTFSRSQWELPTEKQYKAAQIVFAGLLRREYEDLRREYEDLRREYENLRRPFKVTSDVPYTDVWDFPTVQFYKGKHPCEKPLALMEHVITASSRPGDVVLDPFCGSGATGVAARKLGRQFVGIERDAKWVEISRARVGLTTSCSTNQRPQRTINNKNSGIDPVAMSLFA
jgi:site-specific DNA-methyltransferase (adenine-specific)